jgi:hypothetical protein
MHGGKRSDTPPSWRWDRCRGADIGCLQNCVNVGIDCDIIGEIIGEFMDVVIYDIIDL